MMHNKTTTLTLAILMILLVFISCDMLIETESASRNNAVPKANELEVTLNFKQNSSKGLSVKNNLIPVTYKYTAICKTNPNAVGVQTKQTELQITEGQAKLSLIPGIWEISVYCYNSDGGLLLKGSSGEKTLTTESKDIVITCVDANGTDKACVTFIIGAPCVTNGQVEIRYAPVGKSLPRSPQLVITDGIEGFSSTIPIDGIARFTTALNLVPDTYVMQILYSDGVSDISGQFFVLKAVSNTLIKILGDFDYGEYINQNFDISINPVKCDVVLFGSAFDLTAQIQTENVEFISYAWYVNGKLVEGQIGNTLNYVSERLGKYSITCVASGFINGCETYGYATVEYEKSV